MATFLEALWSELQSSFTAYVFGGLVLAAALRSRSKPGSSRRIRTVSAFFLFHLVFVLLSAALANLNAELARWAHLAAVIFAAAVAVGVIVIAGFGALNRIGFDTPPILRELSGALMLLVVVVLAAKREGVDVSGLITTSAVLTAVIGLSLQDTLGNVMAGLVLQSDQSLRVGDWVRVESHNGRIREMRWRYTTIQTRNGETVFMPNSRLVRGDVVVLGRVDEGPIQWRRWVYFNVDFRHPPGDVVQTVTDSLAAAPIVGVATSPTPSCVLMSFEESYGRYAVRYWLTDIQNDDPTDSLVRGRIYFALERVGIPLSIPAEARFITKETETRRARKERDDIARRIQALSRIEFFDALDEDDRRELADAMTRAPFAAGEIITRRGAVAHWLYLMVEGEASVRSDDGSDPRREVAQLGPGEFFGEMSLLTGAPRGATVVALTHVECFRLDKEAFQRLLSRRPELAERFATVLGERQRHLDAAIATGAGERDPSAKSSDPALLAKIRDFFGLRS